jgi:ketosteroid isomerase-like protein
MSQENVELARAMYAELNDTYKRGDDLHRAYETGDYAEFMDEIERTLHDDVVLGTPAGSPFPEGGTGEWRGRDEFVRFVLSQTEAFEEMYIEPEEFIDAADKVVIPLRFGGRARHSGLEVAFPVAHVVTVDQGRIRRVDIFMNRADALQAVGLGEDQDA